MKNKLLVSIFSIFFIVTGFSQSVKPVKELSTKIEKIKKEKPNKKTVELRKKLAYYQSHSPFLKSKQLGNDRPNGVPPNKYYENEWELTMNPALGRPTPENLEVIRREILDERQRILASGRVPGDAVDNSWVERGPTNVGGRTRAIMFDPNDPTRETVFAGGVSGGLWKNTAISNSGSVWTRVNITDNLNVSCLAFDPNNTNIFYLGTGESYTAGDVGGNGVWKSINGGASWTRVLGGVTGATTFQSASNVTVNSPSGAAGNYPCFPNLSFGPTITAPMTSNIVLVSDGSATPTIGCVGFTNSAAVNGKIALIRRGSCTFAVKVMNAQTAGAIAVIIMNNVPGPPAAIGGTDTNITIPSVMISQADGDRLEAALASGDVNVTLNPSNAGVITGSLVPGIQHINKIAIRNNAGVSEVYVAAADSYYGSANSTTYMGSDTFGMYKSINGGSTWAQLNMPLTSSQNKYCPNDIEIGADNKLWISTKNSFAFSEGGGKVFCSSDGGATFVEKYTVTGNGGGERVEIETSATNPNLIYVLSQLNQATATDGVEVQIIKTTDGFATSSIMPLPVGNETRETTYGFTGGQGWYNLTIEADPSNDQIVYVGGIDLYRSSDGGNSWVSISNWTTNVHSDQHAITFKPGNSNIAVFGNDGGVYYGGNLSTATSNSGIDSRNNGFNVTQFYTVGVGPTSIGSGDYFVAGAQDNGSQYFGGVSAGENASVEAQGGDGAASMFDQGTDNYFITNYVYNQRIIYRPTAGANRTINSETTSNGAFICPMALDSSRDILFADYTVPGTTPVYGIRRYTNLKSGTVGKSTLTNTTLITSSPTALNVSKYSTAATTLLAGFRNGKVLISANANASTVTWTELATPNPAANTIKEFALAPSNNQVIYVVKSGSGGISRSVDGGVTFTSCTNPTTAVSPTWVAVSNTNPDVAFVVYSGYTAGDKVFKTNDGGLSWINLSSGLPNIPVNCIVYHNGTLNGDAVYIGTDVGVYYRDNSLSSWVDFTSGLPRIAEAIGPTPGFLAAPPMTNTLSILAPVDFKLSNESMSAHKIDSIAAREIFSFVKLWLLIPASKPCAFGRFGVRSPSK